MAQTPGKITDNLLHVFDYCFVETVHYEFYKPKEGRDIPVNLEGKEYHCEQCGKVTKVFYHKRPLTYYSKGKLAQERRVYDKLGKAFPAMGQLAAGEPFWNEAVGLCHDCARQSVLQSETPEQRVYNLCEELHGLDELVVAKAKAAMEQSLRAWLAGASADDLTAYDLGSFEGVKDMICAVMLQDTTAEQRELEAYQKRAAAIREEVENLLATLPATFQAYAQRSVLVYESMHDKIYHEYTVAFPREDTQPEEYYIRRPLEQSRVRMFLEQPRIETLDELFLEAGFHGEWIDLVTERIRELA